MENRPWRRIAAPIAEELMVAEDTPGSEQDTENRSHREEKRKVRAHAVQVVLTFSPTLALAPWINHRWEGVARGEWGARGYTTGEWCSRSILANKASPGWEGAPGGGDGAGGGDGWEGGSWRREGAVVDP